MRVEVEAGGYDTAGAALTSANQSAAVAYDALRSRLGGYRALGGDDASSEGFVREYDAAAAEAVGALRALVAGLGALSDVTRTSATNHRAANAGSIVGHAAPYDAGLYDGGSPGGGPVTVAAFTPPTALGGDNTDTPEWWDHVVDHLQGYGWPSANTAQLRSAASAWRTAAGTVGGLDERLDTAARHLAGQRSPEIPVALGVLSATRADIATLALGMRGLGEACEDYAQQIEDTRETIRGLLRDLAIECGVTAGFGLALSFVTFGGAAVVGTGVIATRAVKYAHRIVTALRALKAARAILKISDRMAELSRTRQAFERLTTARKLAALQQTAKPRLASTPRQIQAKYKHARHFGVRGNYRKGKVEEFENVLNDFLDHPATRHRAGTYLKEPVNLSFNVETGQVVLMSKSDKFISGWKMSYEQLQHVIRTGDLGGHP